MKTKLLILLSILTITSPLCSAWQMHSIRNAKSGYFLSMENGNHPATCNRTKVGDWEKFYLIPNNGYYLIKSAHNDKFLRRSGNENLFMCVNSYASSDTRMRFGRVQESTPNDLNSDYYTYSFENLSHNFYMKYSNTGYKGLKSNGSNSGNRNQQWIIEKL